jgi:hypothetical protein
MVRKSTCIALAAFLAVTTQVSAQTPYPSTLKVEMKDVTAINSNQTQFRYIITNTSTTGSISGFTVRLWFSKDEYPSQSIVVDKYYSVPAGIALAVEGAPVAALPNVSAVKVVYPSTFTLGPGQSTILDNLQFCVHFNNWYPGTWNKANDWSSVGITGSLSVTNNVTVYLNDGTLVYGNEPSVPYCPDPATVKVEIKDNAPGDVSTSSPRIRITNTSSCATLAAGFKVKFWFSKAEFPTQTIVADKWSVNPAGITLSVGNHGTNPNINFVQVAYPAGYAIGPGQATDPEALQFGVHFKNYYPGVWNKTNDYSWEGITTSLAVTTKVTVYDNAGNLIYGVEP